MRKQSAIIEFDLGTKKTVRDTATQYTPSKTSSSDVLGGWIRALNTKYDYKKIDTLKMGKWIIRFDPQSTAIDTAWTKVIAAIQTGALWEAKVSAVSDRFPNQVILIFTKEVNDTNDIFSTHATLERLGIINLADEIEYKSEQATMQGAEEVLYTSSHARESKQYSRHAFFKHPEQQPLVVSENHAASKGCCIIV